MRRIALGLLVAGGCGVADEPLEVSATEPLPAELTAGDIVWLDSIAVEVPNLGERVSIVIDTDDGTSHSLAIDNVDGVVRVIAPPDESITTIAAVTAPCQDGAFNLGSHRWTTEYRWFFNAGSTPAANSKDNVERGLRNAASAITTSRNNCGLADNVSATHSYRGRTDLKPNIRSADGTVTCSARDEVSVVGFGSLPGNFVGVACTWSDGNGRAVESDIRLDSGRSWFPLDVPGSCSNRFGIQAVATHEFGHTFGLGHVSESAHPHLTMSTAISPCSNAALTLGLGDVRALRSLY